MGSAIALAGGGCGGEARRETVVGIKVEACVPVPTDGRHGDATFEQLGGDWARQAANRIRVAVAALILLGDAGAAQAHMAAPPEAAVPPPGCEAKL